MRTLSLWSRGIRFKLLLMSLVPFFALSIIGFVGVRALKEFGAEIDRAYQVRVPSVEHTTEMKTDIHATARFLWAALAAKSKSEVFAETKKVRGFIDDYVEDAAEFAKLPRSPEIVEKYKKVEETFPLFRKTVEDILALIESHPPDVEARASKMIVETLRPIAGSMMQDLVELQNIRNELMKKDEERLASEDTHTIQLMIWLSLMAALGAFGFGVIVASRLTHGLSDVAATLTVSSHQVSSASTQIAAASRELASATTEQASSLQETASSLAEMSSMVAKNSENAKHAADTTTDCRSKAEGGKETVDHMMRSMEEINASNTRIMDQVTESNIQMAEIVKVIREIGDKTKVINDIVFQTKLLSFNASVEAARAGEHGKGFAVVAEEVGNLAQMSGNAAHEISTMLQESIRKVEVIVTETKTRVESLTAEGRQKIEEGSQIAKQCGTMLEEIVHNVTSVSQMAGEISVASEEQSQGVSELNKAMSQLEQVTQQNTTTSQESASASEQLSSQALALNAAIGRLMELINGGGGQSVSHPVAAKASAPVRKNPKVIPMPPPKKKVEKVEKVATAKPKVREEAPKNAVGSDVPAENHPGFTDI